MPVQTASGCEAAIRTSLPIGTDASIRAGNQLVANGTVRINAFGMIVIVGNNDINPAFISACHIDSIE